MTVYKRVMADKKNDLKGSKKKTNGHKFTCNIHSLSKNPITNSSFLAVENLQEEAPCFLRG